MNSRPIIHDSRPVSDDDLKVLFDRHGKAKIIEVVSQIRTGHDLPKTLRELNDDERIAFRDALEPVTKPEMDFDAGYQVQQAFLTALCGDPNPKLRLRFVSDIDRDADAFEYDGTLEELQPAIRNYEERSYATYYFVNQMRDGIPAYACDTDAIATRALAIDCDGGLPDQYHVAPNIIVYTSVKNGVQRGQALWKVPDLPVANFWNNQRRLGLYYKSDMSICNPSRILRLPGTHHHKDPAHPSMVTFVENSFEDFTTANVLEGITDLPIYKRDPNAIIDWAKHSPHAIREMFAYTDPVLKGDYGAFIGRIKLLAEGNFNLTEDVPEDWYYKTAIDFATGNLRRQYVDKNFPVPVTFKGQHTINEIAGVFANIKNDPTVRFTLFSLYALAVEGGYTKHFDETPMAESFRGANWAELLKVEHQVMMLSGRHSRRYQGTKYTEKRDDPTAPQEFNWKQRRQTKNRDPFSAEEVAELFSTKLYKKKKNPARTARCSFIGKGFHRGYSGEELFDLMMQNLHTFHMHDIKDAQPPQDGEAKLRADIMFMAAQMANNLDRPVVRIIPGNEAEIVDHIEDLLVKNNVPLFSNADVLVRPAEVTFKDKNDNEAVAMRLVQVQQPMLTNTLSREIQFEKFSAQKDAWVPCDCPDVIAKNFVSRSGHRALRPVTGIVQTPALRSDGSVLTQPGLDESTGLLYNPGDIKFPEVPTNPTFEDARAALEFLFKPFSLMDFKTPDDRAVALSLLLTPVSRRITRTVPIFGFTAPEAGCAKSTLPECVNIISEGTMPAHLTWTGKNPEEDRKTLAAALMAGTPFISFDNVSEPIGHPFLEQVATAERLAPRVLGLSKNQTITNNSIVSFTGNNLRLKDAEGGLIRRTVMCSLDPKCEAPAERTFPFSPHQMVMENRPSYVAAELTILKAYMIAGYPVKPSPFGSFEEWSRLVRGAVMWLKVGDPIETQRTLQAQSPDKAELMNLFEAWEAVVSTRGVTIKKLAEAVEPQYGEGETAEAKAARERLLDAIREIAPPKIVVGGRSESFDRKRFGDYLRTKQNRIAGSRTLIIDGKTDHAARWRVFKAR